MNDEEREAFLREKATEPKRLPIAYTDPMTGASVGSQAVVTATEKEIRRFSHGGHVCGECRFFEPGHMEAEMAMTKFLPRLVREFEWKLEHAFVSGINQAGLCGAAGNMLTATIHAACDQFRPHNGKIKRQPKQNEMQNFGEQLSEAKTMQRRRIREWRKGIGRPNGG